MSGPLSRRGESPPPPADGRPISSPTADAPPPTLALFLTALRNRPQTLGAAWVQAGWAPPPPSDHALTKGPPNPLASPADVLLAHLQACGRRPPGPCLIGQQ